MTGMSFYVDIVTDDGEVRVLENEVARINDADLKRLGMSRAELERAFAEGKVLMKKSGNKPGGRIRPVAYREGEEATRLFGDDPKSDDPLLVGLAQEAPVSPFGKSRKSKH